MKYTDKVFQIKDILKLMSNFKHAFELATPLSAFAVSYYDYDCV